MSAQPRDDRWPPRGARRLVVSAAALLLAMVLFATVAYFLRAATAARDASVIIPMPTTVGAQPQP